MPSLDQQLAFLESQASYIEPRARMIMYGSIQYPDLVPIDRSASPWADNIIHYTYDGTGDMIDLANRANDFPIVDVSQKQHSVLIEHKGLAYDWSDREIQRAMQIGVPLSDRKVNIAFRIAEEIKDDVFINGDANKSWDGFINFSSVAVSNSDAAFSGLTSKAWFALLNGVLSDVWTDSNQVRVADTLCLPPTLMQEFCEPLNDGTAVSLLDYFMKANIYTMTTGRPLMIRTLRALETAGKGTGSGVGTGKRIIAYNRDPNVLRYHIPQDLTFSEPQRKGLGWTYFGWMALGGLEILEPGAMRYLDDKNKA